MLLVHPGGPFWRRRDEGAWSIPKGELEPGEDGLEVAYRELAEELGSAPATGEPLPLGSVRQAGGKLVEAWAAEGDFDPAELRSNAFEAEWPPRSGRVQRFAEVDRAGWFDLDSARGKLLPAQREFLDRLAELLSPES